MNWRNVQQRNFLTKFKKARTISANLCFKIELKNYMFCLTQFMLQ